MALLTKDLTCSSFGNKVLKDNFQIEIKTGNDGIVLILVNGFLDAYTYNELERIIINLFNQDIYKLVIDCSGLDYLSSAGAGVLISAIGVAQEHDGNIVLVQPRTQVKEVLDLLGLCQILPIVSSVKAADEILLSRSN